MIAWTLNWLMLFVPAPVDTTFSYRDTTMRVVAVVSEPFHQDLPTRVETPHRFCGWVFKQEFRDAGVSTLNVCVDLKDRIWVFTPYGVNHRVRR